MKYFPFQTPDHLSEQRKRFTFLLYLILNTVPTYIHQRWNLLSGILYYIASRNKESWKGLEDGGVFSQQLYQTLEKAIAVLNIINTLIFLQVE